MAINYLALILLTRAFIYHSQRPRPNARFCPFSRCLKCFPEQHPTLYQVGQQDQHPQISPVAAAAHAHLAQTAARCCPDKCRMQSPSAHSLGSSTAVGARTDPWLDTVTTAGRHEPARAAVTGHTCTNSCRGPAPPSHRAEGPAAVGLGSRTKQRERI